MFLPAASLPFPFLAPPMPFMQRLTWSGIALHASNSVPHHPASHGCVRMPHKFAGKLFKMATRGAHVVVEDNPQTPEYIQHDALFQPIVTWQPSRKYDAWVNAEIERQNFGFLETDHRHPARIFITRRTHKDEIYAVQNLLNGLGFDAGEVDGIMGPATWQAIATFQKSNNRQADGKINTELLDMLYKAADKTRPANGRLLVRSHHRTVYATQVHIEDAETPLGSHLLTVSEYNKKVGTTKWMSITLNDRIQETIHLKNGKQVDPITGRADVRDTLSRIQMSKHDHNQISRLLSAKSSITISDNGISIETGATGTDFIVLTDPDVSLATASSLHKIAG